MIRLISVTAISTLLTLWQPAQAAEDAAGEAAAAAVKSQKKAALARDKADAMMDELGDPTRHSPTAAARNAQLDLQFFDAVSGNPIPGATVTFGGVSATGPRRQCIRALVLLVIV